MSKIFRYALTVEQVMLKVHLGVGKKEQSKKQKVAISLRLDIPKLPPKDKAEDYICYGKISEAMREYCEGRRFRLIEALGLQLFDLVRKQVPKEVAISFKLHKCKLPLTYVKGGACFYYSDLPADARRVSEI